MFDIGFAEIFLLGLIGLLVLGPERLPGVARTIGGFVRKARASWTSLRQTIESEMAEADIKEPLQKVSDELREIGKNLTDTPGLTSGNSEPPHVPDKPESESDTENDVSKPSENDDGTR